MQDAEVDFRPQIGGTAVNAFFDCEVAVEEGRLRNLGRGTLPDEVDARAAMGTVEFEKTTEDASPEVRRDTQEAEFVVAGIRGDGLNGTSRNRTADDDVVRGCWIGGKDGR